MFRCSAVYQTGTYGAMGGARVNALPLPYPGLSIMFVRGYRLFSDFAYGQTADSRQTQEDQAEPQDGVGAVAGLRDGVGAAVGTAVGAAVRAVVETGVGAGSGSGGCRN